MDCQLKRHHMKLNLDEVTTEKLAKDLTLAAMVKAVLHQKALTLTAMWPTVLTLESLSNPPSERPHSLS